MKAERLTKRSSFGTIIRNRISDITNSQTVKPRSSVKDDQDPPQNLHSNYKDYIDQLIKEKMALAKIITERNKIIEISGEELQRLRVSVQKLQLQNWHLAQSNTQMSAELNSGKEKLKTLHHEIVCKDVLLKAKNLELEGKLKPVNEKKTELQEGEKAEGKSSQTDNDDERKASNRNIRILRSQSMGASTQNETVADNDKAENKRPCLRRQSARFNKSHEKENTENLFEIEDAKFPSNQALETPIREEDYTSNRKVEEAKENSSALRQRSSIGRPVRKAAEKVQSYKEVPLNVKMRRNE